MKAVLLLAVVLAGLAACSREPTPEEIARQQEEQAAQARGTPKPGDWMWKGYKNPLEHHPAK